MALVILGMGNDLLGDDAVGLMAAAGLEGRFGPDVQVARSARSGLYILEDLLGFDDAILIDSVIGDVPGRVRELEPGEVRPVPVPSAHYAGLPEALALAERSGLKVPDRIRIFAVEIDAAQRIGSPASPAIAAAVPEVVSRVERAAAEWGYGSPGSAAPAVGPHA